MRVSLPRRVKNVFEEYEDYLKESTRELRPVSLPFTTNKSETIRRDYNGLGGSENIYEVNEDDIGWSVSDAEREVEELERASRDSDASRIVEEIEKHVTDSRAFPSSFILTRHLGKETDFRSVEEPVVIGQYVSGYKFDFRQIFSASGSELYPIASNKEVEDKKALNSIQIQLSDDENIFQVIENSNKDVGSYPSLLSLLSDSLHLDEYKAQTKQTENHRDESLYHLKMILCAVPGNLMNIIHEGDIALKAFPIQLYDVRTRGFSQVQTIFDDNITQDDLFNRDEAVLMDHVNSTNLLEIRVRVLKRLLPLHHHNLCNNTSSPFNHNDVIIQPVEQPLCLFVTYQDHLIELEGHHLSFVYGGGEDFILPKAEVDNIIHKEEMEYQRVIGSLFSDDLEHIRNSRIRRKLYTSDGSFMDVTRKKLLGLDLTNILKQPKLTDGSSQINESVLGNIVGSQFISQLYLSFSKAIPFVRKLKLLNSTFLLLSSPLYERDVLRKLGDYGEDFAEVDRLLDTEFSSFMKAVIPQNEIEETRISSEKDKKVGVKDANTDEEDKEGQFLLMLSPSSLHGRKMNPLSNDNENISLKSNTPSRRILEAPDIIPLHESANLTPWHIGTSKVPPMKKLRRLSTLSSHRLAVASPNHIEYPPPPPAIEMGYYNDDGNIHVASREEKRKDNRALISEFMDKFGISEGVEKTGTTKVLMIPLPQISPKDDKREHNNNIPLNIEKAISLSIQLQLAVMMMGGLICGGNGNDNDAFDVEVEKVMEYDDIKERLYSFPSDSIWGNMMKRAKTRDRKCGLILPHRNKVNHDECGEDYIIDFVIYSADEDESSIQVCIDNLRPNVVCTTVLTESHFYLEAMIKKGLNELVDILKGEGYKTETEEPSEKMEEMFVTNMTRYATQILQEIKGFLGKKDILYKLAKCLFDIWLLAMVSPKYAAKRLIHVSRRKGKRTKKSTLPSLLSSSSKSLRHEITGSRHPICNSLLTCEMVGNDGGGIFSRILECLTREQEKSVDISKVFKLLNYGKPLVVISEYYSRMKRMISKISKVKKRDIFEIDQTRKLYDALNDETLGSYVPTGNYTHFIFIGFFDPVNIQLSSPAIIPLCKEFISGYNMMDDSSSNILRMLIDVEKREIQFSSSVNKFCSIPSFLILPTINKDSPLSPFSLSLGYSKLKSISIHFDVSKTVVEALGRRCKINIYNGENERKYGYIVFKAGNGSEREGVYVIVMMRSDAHTRFKDEQDQILATSRHIASSLGQKTRVVGVIIRMRRDERNDRAEDRREYFITDGNLFGVALHSQYFGAPIVYARNNYEVTLQIFRILSFFPSFIDESSGEASYEENGEMSVRNDDIMQEENEEERDFYEEETFLRSGDANGIPHQQSEPRPTMTARKIDHLTPDMIPFTLPGRDKGSLSKISRGKPQERPIALSRLPGSSQTIITWADTSMFDKRRVTTGVNESGTTNRAISYSKKGTTETGFSDLGVGTASRKDKGGRTIGFQSARW